MIVDHHCMAASATSSQGATIVLCKGLGRVHLKYCIQSSHLHFRDYLDLEQVEEDCWVDKGNGKFIL